MTLQEEQMLLQRVHHLEQWQAQADSFETKDISASFRQNAGFRALQSIVYELANHAGIEHPALQAAFELRKLHYLDVSYRQAESRHSASAASLDDRTPEEIPTEENYPSLLFP